MGLHTVITSSFSTKNINEYRAKTIDKPPYLYSDNLTNHYSKGKSRKEKEIENWSKKFSAYVLNRSLQYDLFKRLGKSNINDYFLIRNALVDYINSNLEKKRFAKHYFDYSQTSEFIRNNKDEIVQRSVNFYKDIIGSDIMKDVLKFDNYKQMHAFIDNVAMLSFVAYTPFVENRFYKFDQILNNYYDIEKSMKLEKIYASPLTWSSISLLQKSQEYLDAIDIALRTNTFSDFTYDYKMYAIKQSQEDLTKLDTYLNGLRDAYIDAIEKGGLSIMIAGEVGSALTTQIALRVLSQSLIYASALIPQGRLLSLGSKALYELGNFIGKSFVANFAFQVNVEWAVDGWIQEILQPYVDKLLGTEVFQDEYRSKLSGIMKEYRLYIQCKEFNRYCDAVERLGIKKEDIINRLYELGGVEKANQYINMMEMYRFKLHSAKAFREAFKRKKHKLIDDINKLMNDIKYNFPENIIDNNTNKLKADVVYDMFKDIIPEKVKSRLKNLIDDGKDFSSETYIYNPYCFNPYGDYFDRYKFQEGFLNQYFNNETSSHANISLYEKGHTIRYIQGIVFDTTQYVASGFFINYVNHNSSKKELRFSVFDYNGKVSFCNCRSRDIDVIQTQNIVYYGFEDTSGGNEYISCPAPYRKFMKLLLFPNHYIESVYIDKCFLVIKFSSKVAKKIDINELINCYWYVTTSASVYNNKTEVKTDKTIMIKNFHYIDREGKCWEDIYKGFSINSYFTEKKDAKNFNASKYKNVYISSYLYDNKTLNVNINRYMYGIKSYSTFYKTDYITNINNFNSKETNKNSNYVYKYAYLYEYLSFKIDLEKTKIIENSIYKSMYTNLIDRNIVVANDDVIYPRDIRNYNIEPQKLPLEVFLI